MALVNFFLSFSILFAARNELVCCTRNGSLQFLSKYWKEAFNESVFNEGIKAYDRTDSWSLTIFKLLLNTFFLRLNTYPVIAVVNRRTARENCYKFTKAIRLV